MSSVGPAPRVTSFPKSKIRTVLFEGVHPKGVSLLEREGYPVDAYKGAAGESELLKAVLESSLLGVRSKTQVTAEALGAARRLLAVGAFCVGTDQTDLTAATLNGVAVFNAPFSNTRSVVELALGAVIMLSRRAFDKSVALHGGVWDKSAVGACEIRGKTLGIVGYGSIGKQLSVLAEAAGMRVLFFDIEETLALGNARRAGSLDELLESADYVSLHTDGRSENDGLFGAREFHRMKKGAYFINYARGRLVDLVALRAAIESDHLGGVAVDVFPDEPGGNGPGFECGLKGLPNVILTPHIGGSTAEAQENIAEFVAHKLIDYVNTGSTSGCVNLPQISLPPQAGTHRFLHIHQNVPGVMAQINKVIAGADCNVEGQYLKTNEHVGYVITDLDKAYDHRLVEELKAIPETIRFRVLY